jgi:dTDP-4-dehydrorhamnose reductase
MIRNETELEDLLTRPTERDKAAMLGLRGPLLILGAGGKMGPTLAVRAKRAGARHVIAVARYSSPETKLNLENAGIETIAADLLADDALRTIPDAPHVIFMAAMKFGTTGAEHLTWAMNTFLPGLVAQRYRDAEIVAFSTATCIR